MSTKPSFFRRMFGAEVATARPPVPHASPAPATPKPPSSPFGAFGEKGEKVGEQIAYFLTRLDELYSLRQDFASVAAPMQDFIVSHAEAQTRLAEATALLARERAESHSLRGEVGTLRVGIAKLENGFAESNNQLKIQEDVAEGRGTQLRALQLAHDDALSKLDWGNRQLALEVQSNQDQANAHRIMGDDLNRVGQELAMERARYLELRDQHDAVGSETKRLQGLVERLQPAFASAKRRVGELETDAGAMVTTIGMLELKIAGEQETRRATEAARAQDKIAFENEIETLTLQIDALESRHQTTTKLFDQSRGLLNEKIDEVRLSERAAKDALAEKIVAERRHGAAQDEIRRLQDQGAALAGRHTEAQERCSMLSNAMAAKDAHIEQLQSRCEAIKSQHDDAVARHEQERAAVDALNRKLIEEVQGERAERALAQGALSIARGSREKLLTQIEDLKRGRFARPPEHGLADVHEAPLDHDTQNNIHKFRTPDHPVDGA